MTQIINLPEWNKDFNVGIDEVDFQHRYFLELIRRLNAELTEDIPEYMQKRQLNEVVKYAEFHFYSEENLMLLHHYPQIEEHQMLHNKLIDKLTNLVNYNEAGIQNIEEIIQFMFDWFIDHTVKEDRQFALFLKEQ